MDGQLLFELPQNLSPHEVEPLLSLQDLTHRFFRFPMS